MFRKSKVNSDFASSSPIARSHHSAATTQTTAGLHNRRPGSSLKRGTLPPHPHHVVRQWIRGLILFRVRHGLVPLRQSAAGKHPLHAFLAAKPCCTIGQNSQVNTTMRRHNCHTVNHVTNALYANGAKTPNLHVCLIFSSQILAVSNAF